MTFDEFQRRVNAAWHDNAAEVYYGDDEYFELDEDDCYSDERFVTFWLLVLASRGEL